MRSKGWPERIQVGILVGDMMDSIEGKYKEEKSLRASAKTEDKRKKKISKSELLDEKGSFAGFL
jgi:hypothetical protein